MKESSRQLNRSSSGFTLIEVLITLAIIGIILGLGVGGFGSQIDSAKVRKTADTLKASIAQARGEAITHGGNVRVCGSSDGSSCVNSLDSGWLSYYDENTDGVLSATDTILSWQEIDYAGSSIVATDSAGNEVTEFGFNYRGYPLLPIALDVNGRIAEFDVQLSANGRVEVQ